MKKIIICLFILLVYATPVYADNLNNQTIYYSGLENKNKEPIWGNEQDRVFYDNDALDKRQDLRRIAGITWLNQELLSIEFLDVMEDNTLLITVKDSDYSKEHRIRNYIDQNSTRGKDVKIKFNDISRLSESAAWIKYYFIADDTRYMGCEGKLIELKHTPYMKNGYLMIPLRDVCKILSETTNGSYSVNWVGGEDEILEINSSAAGVQVIISVKNNQIRIGGYEFYSLEGTVENKNGTIYMPYTFENMNPAFHVWDDPEFWDEKTRLAVITS